MKSPYKFSFNTRYELRVIIFGLIIIIQKEKENNERKKGEGSRIKLKVDFPLLASYIHGNYSCNLHTWQQFMQLHTWQLFDFPLLPS